MNARERWMAAAHAVQSGVAYEIEISPQTAAISPKSLRVGVNGAMADHAGLALLLIKKGLITEDEYLEAIAESMEMEQKRYEQNLSRILGRPVTLG